MIPLQQIYMKIMKTMENKRLKQKQMKKIGFYVMAAAIVLTTACKKEKDDTRQMIISAKNISRMQFSMAGSGSATINWGDGTKIEKVALGNNKDWAGLVGYIPLQFTFRHDYSGSSSYTLTINGKITHLWCSDFEMTIFDVSHNSAIELIRCRDNQLTTKALNDLFASLVENTDVKLQKRVLISGNPGAEDCDRSIAENKGWLVEP